MIHSFQVKYSIVRALSTRLGFCLVVVLFLSSCKKEGDLIFDDGFEYYELGVAPRGPWSTSGKGNIRVDSTRRHSGKYAVYIESEEGFDQRALLRLTGNPLFPFMYNRITGSFYLWLEEASPDGVHWTMIEALGPVRDQDFRSSIRYGGQHQKRLMANYDTQGVKTDCWQHSSTPIPEKEWVKVGWQFDGMKQTAKFWLNNQLIQDITIVGSGQGCLGDDLNGQWIFPVFEELLIGWVDYQTGGGTRRLWIDDVKLYY